MPSCSQVGQVVPAREATKECASSCRSTRTRSGVGACDAHHRHADRAVVPGGHPLGGARRVPEAGGGLKHYGDRQARSEAEPLLVLAPCGVEHAEHGEAKGLVGGAVVADPEAGARRKQRRSGERIELALDPRLRIELQRDAVLLARVHEVGQLGEGVRQALVGERVAPVERDRLLRALARPLGVTERDLSRGQRLQSGDRRGLSEEREPGQAQRLGRVSGGQAFARSGRRPDPGASRRRPRPSTRFTSARGMANRPPSLR